MDGIKKQIGTFLVAGEEVSIELTEYENFDTVLAYIRIQLSEGTEPVYYNATGRRVSDALSSLSHVMGNVSSTVIHFESRFVPVELARQASVIHQISLALQAMAFCFGEKLVDDHSANHPDYPRVASAA